MNRGYVKVWRKSLDDGWIRNHKLWAFWTYCLLKATYQEFDAIVGLQIVHLMPGQFVFGLRVASKETGLSIQEIRTIIDFLKKAGNLTIKSTNKFSIISIINWNIYQSDNTDEQHRKQQTTNKQLTTYKHNKNKIFLSDSIEVRLSEVLLEKILTRNPNHKKPNLQTWAKHIDLTIRIDHRTPEDIRAVIEWCQSDTFWQNNILSTAKLRNQFDQLRLKMGSPAPDPKNAPPSVHTLPCPACRRTVLSSDMAGEVCILCAEVQAHA